MMIKWILSNCIMEILNIKILYFIFNLADFYDLNDTVTVIKVCCPNGFDEVLTYRLIYEFKIN